MDDSGGIRFTTNTEASGYFNKRILTEYDYPTHEKYVTDDIDETIGSYCYDNPYVFGHSSALNDMLGYWVHVFTLFQQSTADKYAAQIALSQPGTAKSNMAIRVYNSQNGWNNWEKVISCNNANAFFNFNHLKFTDGSAFDQLVIPLYYYGDGNFAGLGVDPGGNVYLRTGLNNDTKRSFVFGTGGNFQANNGDIINSQGHTLSSTTATANAAYTMAQELTNKFNNLFTQSGNTLTINY